MPAPGRRPRQGPRLDGGPETGGRAIKPRMPEDNSAADSTAAQHTSPEEAGRPFAAARPGLAAYTQFVLVTRPRVPPVSAEQI